MPSAHFGLAWPFCGKKNLSVMNKALLLLLVLFTLCRDQDAQAQQDLTTQPPCLPIAESLLAPLEGAWTVEWTYRTAPGEFAKSMAQSRIEQDLYGCALIEHFEGTLRSLPFSAITLFSQKAEGHFDRVRIDSEHGSFTQSEGHVAGDSLVFEWQRDLGERVLRTRHFFFEMTGESFTVEYYMSRSSGAPWALVQRARYRKRGSGE